MRPAPRTLHGCPLDLEPDVPFVPSIFGVFHWRGCDVARFLHRAAARADGHGVGDVFDSPEQRGLVCDVVEVTAAVQAGVVHRPASGHLKTEPRTVLQAVHVALLVRDVVAPDSRVLLYPDVHCGPQPKTTFGKRQ